MDINTCRKYIDQLIKRAPEFGFEDCVAGLASGTSMSISIFKGEVSSYENSVELDIAFRGKRNGQLGKASTSVINDDTVEFLLKSASENCDLLNDEDEEIIYCDPEHPDLEHISLSGTWDKNTYDRFAEIGLRLEKAILEMDPLVKAVDSLGIGCSTGPTIKVNSKGLHIYSDSDRISIYASARAEKDGITKSAGNYWYGKDIDTFDQDKFVSELKDKLIPKFGGRSVSSGKYDIILNNESTIELFQAFMGSFSSYGMAKGISLLAGKEGSVIASDIVTLTDDPFAEKALEKIPFDGEGVLTYKKNIIENGVFKTAFYNLKTAAMTGKKSTGNGFGEAIGPTNLILQPGSSDLKEMAEHVGNGLYITEISGLHAGLNPISGDFSLLAEGYLIQDGKIDRAVEQITISDNFFSILMKIREIGSDVICQPDSIGEFISPSIVIPDVAVAGENKE